MHGQCRGKCLQKRFRPDDLNSTEKEGIKMAYSYMNDDAAWADFGKYMYEVLPAWVIRAAAKKLDPEHEHASILAGMTKAELAEFIMEFIAE